MNIVGRGSSKSNMDLERNTMNYFRTFRGDEKTFKGTLFPFSLCGLCVTTKTKTLSFRKTRPAIYSELVEKTKEIFESLTLPTRITVVNHDTFVKVTIRVGKNNVVELDDIITNLKDVVKISKGGE